MQRKPVQLQSILLPDKAVCDIEELYYHRNRNRIDFNGYFNLFYIEKRKRYTDIYNLYLDIRLQGYSSLILVHDEKDIGKVELEAGEMRNYRISFPYGKYQDGCFWFALVMEESEGLDNSGRSIPDGAVYTKTNSNTKTGLPRDKTDRIVSGFYKTELAADRIRDVRIGTVICTYRREEYVARNLRQLKERILERPELDVSSRVKLYIIDNGKTLDGCEKIQNLAANCAGRTEILPNKNAGGAGGFTRGMIEVLKAKEREGFTHVLLMDDDAVFEPDAFVRIHGLAATLKEKWKDITIGGAMLREEMPHILYCAGEWWKNSMSVRPEMNLDLRRYESAICEYLTGTGMERELYSGWWLCCYSLNVVREDNLPLPLFIHHDDIEFGLRNLEQGIVFLNGICVWHRGGDTVFPGSNYYYDIRNNLIETALHEKKMQTVAAAKIMTHAFIASIVRMKYRDRNLAYKALVDFSKGPEWLWQQDSERLNRKIKNMAYVMLPTEDLWEQFTIKEYEDITRQLQRDWDAYGSKAVARQEGHRTKRTILHDLTLNGWLLPGNREVKIITPLDSPFDTFRRRKVLLYEPGSRKALVVRRDYRELIIGVHMYIKVLVKLKHFPSVRRNYERNWKNLANQKAWEEYLEI